MTEECLGRAGERARDHWGALGQLVFKTAPLCSVIMCLVGKKCWDSTGLDIPGLPISTPKEPLIPKESFIEPQMFKALIPQRKKKGDVIKTGDWHRSLGISDWVGQCKTWGHNYLLLWNSRPPKESHWTLQLYGLFCRPKRKVGQTPPFT